MSRQKRKTPKVEAWALVDAKGEICSLQTDEWWPAHLLERHTRVRLVPADPAKERVVRLERKAIALARVLVAALWGNGKPCAAGEAELRVTLVRLTSAVEKFQKGRRK